MSFALIRDADRAIVEISDTKGPAFPQSTWLAGAYDRALHLGKTMNPDGTVDMSVDPAIAAEQARQATFTSDANVADMLGRLRTADAAQIASFINNNVTNLSQAKDFLIRLASVLAMMARRI